MADLAGKFHFAGESQGVQAQRIAVELRKLGALCNQLSGLTWYPYQNEQGVQAVGARVDRIRTLHIVGDWLESKGIISDYKMIEFRPEEEEELVGKDRHYVLAIELIDIDEDRLGETGNALASREVTSLFFRDERTFS